MDLLRLHVMKFMTRRVAPTHYSIRSCYDERGGRHPKSWVLEVSNDNSSWNIVDQRENNKDLNDKRVIRYFWIVCGSGGSFRFIRLRQTGKNHASSNLLCIASLEVFGTLFDEDSR